MSETINQTKPMVKRLFQIVAGIILLVFIIALMILIWTGSSAFEPNTYLAQAGYINLKGYDFETGRPIKFDGAWEFYPDIQFDGSAQASAAFVNPKEVNLPIESYEEAAINGVYRLNISTSKSSSDARMLLYLPYSNEEFSLYFNRQRIMPLQRDGDNGFLSIFAYELVFDANEMSHELIISVGNGTDRALFFQNSVVFGPIGDMQNMISWQWARSFFNIGFLALAFLIGLVFMLLCPEHRLITRLTILDNLLILRLFVGTPELILLCRSLFGFEWLSKIMIQGLQFSLIFLAGIAACFLADNIFNRNRSSLLSKILMTVYAGMAVFSALRPTLMLRYGQTCALIVFAITVIMICTNILRTLRKHPTGYYVFQTLKTAYICFVLAWDLLCIFNAAEVSYTVITYLYMLFFCMHIVLRLMDNNSNYRMVELLNANLESIVEERTRQLRDANTRLEDLSIKDPLTGVYNRLYFEDHIEKMIENPAFDQENLYLCMMDIDHFKLVNDAYGHDVGDNVLKTLVDIVASLLDPDMTFARIGGEEFVILVSGYDPDHVKIRFEVIRSAVAANVEMDTRNTTVSFGVVRYQPGMRYKDLLKQADQCLYEAKALGRNRVVCRM